MSVLHIGKDWFIFGDGNNNNITTDDGSSININGRHKVKDSFDERFGELSTVEAVLLILFLTVLIVAAIGGYVFVLAYLIIKCPVVGTINLILHLLYLLN